LAFVQKSSIYTEDAEGKTRGPPWKREKLGISEKRIMYRITFLLTAEVSFKKLAPPTQRRIAQKIDWLSANADKIIHHPLKSLPDDLRGLCRMRMGDYRIIYWVYDELKHIKIYDIEHRGKDYRSLKK
jgi:mRNA-degrading endonuclease RelE of RelBE toxin-antitoxin system